MKIAHINYIPNYMTGINQKIGHQSKAAQSINIDMDFIILNNGLSQESRNLKLIKMNSFKLIPWLNKIKNLFFAYRLIEENIDLNQYDYIIIRYMVPDISSKRFIKKYGYKVITEHHTNELVELQSYKGISNKLRYMMEKVFAPNFLSKVKGIIAVTYEIEQIELGRSNIQNSTVISNGIDVNKTKITRCKEFDSSSITLIFVASFTALWQGVNRVLEGLSQYDGTVKVTFLIVGGISQDCKKKISKINRVNVEIKVLGEKHNSDLDKLFEQSDIAISSLALHKKNMKEACSLKTREYIARGIPFVYGYDDTDLTGDETFALKVPANDEPLDIEEIIKFSQKVSQIEGLSYTMRDFAKENLDWKIKIQKMYDFIQMIDTQKKEN
jgi:glycosyltransferase involved in cell wall biosynthesis